MNNENIKFNIPEPLKKLEDQLIDKEISFEKFDEEVKKFESQVNQTGDKVEQIGDQILESGLQSLGSKNPASIAEGKSIVNAFTEKAVDLKNNFLGKMKMAVTALGVFAPAVVPAQQQKPPMVQKSPEAPKKDAKTLPEVKIESKVTDYAKRLEVYNRSQALIEQWKNTNILTQKQFNADGSPMVVHPKMEIVPNEEAPNGAYSWMDLDYDVVPVNFTKVYYSTETTGDVEYIPNYEKPIPPPPAPKKKEVKREIVEPVTIAPIKSVLLETSNPSLGDIERIPFKKGTYFTMSRDRQTQELGSKQFGRTGLVDFFDNKTGDLLGTYPEDWITDKE